MPAVLRIINRLNLGGPTYNAAYLTKHLAPEFDTVLLAGIKQDAEESSAFIVERMGLPVTYLPRMRREINLLDDVATYRGIKRVIRKVKPDIVHTHAAKAGTLGRLAAHACGVPVIVHTFHGHVFHSYFSRTKTRFFLNVERYLAARSSAIVALSALQKDELCNRFRICPADRCHVIPLGFDLLRFAEDTASKRTAFRNRYGLDDDDVAVGIIGRLTAIKDHRFFLDAFREARAAAGRRLRAVVIGDGEEREALVMHCTAAGLTVDLPDQPPAGGDVVFTSWIKDVDRAIAGLDIVALTSLNEGTPVSLIEAQAGGRAVISTMAGGTADVVADGKTGLLSAIGDRAAFVHNLASLAHDKAMRDAFGTAGRSHVMENYHYSRLVEDMRRLYRNLLSAHR